MAAELIEGLPPAIRAHLGDISTRPTPSSALTHAAGASQWNLMIGQTSGSVRVAVRHEVLGHLFYSLSNRYRMEAERVVPCIARHDPKLFLTLLGRGDVDDGRERIQYYYRQGIQNMAVGLLAFLDDVSERGPRDRLIERAGPILNEALAEFRREHPGDPATFLLAPQLAFWRLHPLIRELYGEVIASKVQSAMVASSHLDGVDEFLAHVIGYGGSFVRSLARQFPEDSLVAQHLLQTLEGRGLETLPLDEIQGGGGLVQK